METMVLVGAEQLTSALHSLRDVAHTIQQAVSAQEYALTQHQAFMNDWLSRFEQILKDNHSHGPRLQEL